MGNRPKPRGREFGISRTVDPGYIFQRGKRNSTFEETDRVNAANAPTVLLAWELGGGLGHVGRLLPLARGLSERGYRPVLALRDLIEPNGLLRAESFPLLQAPRFPPMSLGKPFHARSFADILAVHGFGDVSLLRTMVRAWQAMLDLVRPALVIGDHCPTLGLAARGRVPTILLGNGFCLPPLVGLEFPPLQPECEALIPAEQLLAAVQEVQRERGAPLPRTLPEILTGTARFVTVLPQLDPYQASRDQPVAGDLEALPEPLPPPVERSFFVYLATESPFVEEILTQLAQTGVPGRGYIRGVGQGLHERLGRSGLYLSPKPLPLWDEMARACVVVHHGNQGISQMALAAGRPQLVFPMHLEQLLNARQLHALGLAHFLTGKPPAMHIAEGLRQLLHEPRFAERAQIVAADLQRTGPWNSLSAILQRGETLLADHATV